jgi:hypothetical protein
MKTCSESFVVVWRPRIFLLWLICVPALNLRGLPKSDHQAGGLTLGT